MDQRIAHDECSCALGKMKGHFALNRAFNRNYGEAGEHLLEAAGGLDLRLEILGCTGSTEDWGLKLGGKLIGGAPMIRVRNGDGLDGSEPEQFGPGCGGQWDRVDD